MDDWMDDDYAIDEFQPEPDLPDCFVPGFGPYPACPGEDNGYGIDSNGHMTKCVNCMFYEGD